MGSSTTPLPRAALRYAACCALHVLAPEDAEGALALCGEWLRLTPVGAHPLL